MKTSTVVDVTRALTEAFLPAVRANIERELDAAVWGIRRELDEKLKQIVKENLDRLVIEIHRLVETNTALPKIEICARLEKK